MPAEFIFLSCYVLFPLALSALAFSAVLVCALDYDALRASVDG